MIVATWQLTFGGVWHLQGSQCKNKNGEQMTRLNTSSLPTKGQLCPVCLDRYRALIAGQVREPENERRPRAKPAASNNMAFAPTPLDELTPAQRKARRRAVRKEMEQEERRARVPRLPSAGSPGLGKRR